jgi:uncharacterized membrane protein
MAGEHKEEGLGEGDEWLAFSPESPASPARVPHPLVIVAALLGVLVLIGMVALRPTGDGRERAVGELSALGVPSEFYGARVIDVVAAPCAFAQEIECTTVTFELTAGPDAGSEFVQEFSEGTITPQFDVGRSVVLSYRPPNARLVTTTAVPCDFDADLTCTQVVARLTTGDLIGQTITYQVLDVEGPFFTGDDLEVTFTDSADGVEVVGIAPVDVSTQYRFSDMQRRPVLAWITVVFAAAVIALGRWKGVAALAGLGATVLVVVWWLLPAILDGRSPVLVALVGAAAIAYLALYLAHGISLMTTVALIGTLGALLLTTLLASATVAAAQFTGLASEEGTLLTLFEGIDIRGLVLAGMVLGAAGALDDVTVTQASAVWQIRAADPSLGWRGLFGRGLKIGQDHIGSTVNTLLLAYLGAALPLAILFVLAEQSLGTVANSEVVAIEIARTLVGSIGLVAAVPLTTYMASVVARRS